VPQGYVEDEHDNVCAILMEPFPEGDLLCLLGRHRDMGAFERAQWMLATAVAMYEAHASGIVHCDVKENNFMASTAGSSSGSRRRHSSHHSSHSVIDFNGLNAGMMSEIMASCVAVTGGRTCTLVDYGQARRLAFPSAALDSLRGGTEGYVPPEADTPGATAAAWTAAGDIYSLGKTFLSMLDPDANVGVVAEWAPKVAIPEVASDVLRGLVMAMVRQDPAMRPTLIEVISTLRQLLAMMQG
jgi:serine/threonine protein kinase